MSARALRTLRRVAVVGGGWAGLSAAVQAVQLGHAVHLFEMAHHLGGRARTVPHDGGWVDNGQHILIGAYTATLDLMRTVGIDPTALLLRRPLSLTLPDGSGLKLPAGHPATSFARAVWAVKQWSPLQRLTLLMTAGRWLASGFRCPAGITVAQLCRSLPPVVVHDLIDPLCTAALNTPLDTASGATFLRVLHDALLSGPGSADLLLPKVGLSSLLPEAAAAWLKAHGAVIQTGQRVQALQGQPSGDWLVDGAAFDAVVLACSATEAARLAQAVAPEWAGQARAMRYEPIVTAYLRDDSLRLPEPMHRLVNDGQSPAQFIFDLHALSGLPAHQGVFALVASSAAQALQSSLATCTELLLAQARRAFAGHFKQADAVWHVAAERRATFACTAGLVRPGSRIAPHLWAAGDYVAGPYPATLEGAVRAGQEAAQQIGVP